MDQRDLLDLQEKGDQGVLLDHRDQVVHVGSLELVVTLEPLDPEVQLVLQDNLDPLDQLDHQVPVVLLDLEEQVEKGDLLEKMALMGRQVSD